MYSKACVAWTYYLPGIQFIYRKAQKLSVSASLLLFQEHSEEVTSMNYFPETNW